MEQRRWLGYHLVPIDQPLSESTPPIIDLKANMMLPTQGICLKKFGDRAGLIHGFDQFDLAIAHIHKADPYPLLFHLELRTDVRRSQGVPIQSD